MKKSLIALCALAAVAAVGMVATATSYARAVPLMLVAGLRHVRESLSFWALGVFDRVSFAMRRIVLRPEVAVRVTGKGLQMRQVKRRPQVHPRWRMCPST